MFYWEKDECNSLDKKHIWVHHVPIVKKANAVQWKSSFNSFWWAVVMESPIFFGLIFFTFFFFTQNASCFLHTSAVTVSSSACISTVGRRDTFLLAEIDTLTQCRAQIAWSSQTQTKIRQFLVMCVWHCSLVTLCWRSILIQSQRYSAVVLSSTIYYDIVCHREHHGEATLSFFHKSVNWLLQVPSGNQKGCSEMPNVLHKTICLLHPLEPHPVWSHSHRVHKLWETLSCAHLSRWLNSNNTTKQTFSGWAIESHYKTIRVQKGLCNTRPKKETNSKTKTESHSSKQTISMKWFHWVGGTCEWTPVLSASLMYFCVWRSVLFKGGYGRTFSRYPNTCAHTTVCCVGAGQVLGEWTSFLSCPDMWALRPLILLLLLLFFPSGVLYWSIKLYSKLLPLSGLIGFRMFLLQLLAIER